MSPGSPRTPESWLLTRIRIRIGFIVFYSVMTLLCLVVAWQRDQPGLLVGALVMAAFLPINIKWLRDLNRDLARTRLARDL